MTEPAFDMAWQNVSDAVFAHAARHPRAPALIDGPARLDYGALADLVGKAAVHLHDLAIQPGERVGLAMTNSIDHVVLLFALMRIGAVPVELSADDDSAVLAATARRYAIGRIFADPHLPPPPGIPCVAVDAGWRRRIAAGSGDWRRAAATEDALFAIVLTSGSTGVPAGLMTTHRQFMRRGRVEHDYYAAHLRAAPDRPAHFLLTATLRYAWYFFSLIGQVCAGAAIVILPEYAKPIDFVRAIAAWPDAVCSVTANMCRFFLSAAPPDGPLFPDVRLMTGGGMPLFAAEKQAMLARVTPNFFERYGTAGLGMISCLAPGEMAAKAGSVGRPVPGVALEIVDDDDRVLPAGAAGRIRCRAPTMSLGRCPEDAGAGAEYFRDGWYYPGEIGALDAEGYLSLRGRAAEAIRRGGVAIYAPEIEEALLAHPGIAEVAVVGRPPADAGGREEAVAFVVRRGALSHDELARYCRERLAPARWPDRVFYADSLPRLPGGKIDRLRLVALAVQKLAAGSAD